MAATRLSQPAATARDCEVLRRLALPGQAELDLLVVGRAEDIRFT